MMFKLAEDIPGTSIIRGSSKASKMTMTGRCPEKAIRFYIAKISQKSLTENQSQTQMALQHRDEIEAIGDIVSKDIVALSFKKRKDGSFFRRRMGGAGKAVFLINENFDLTMAMMVHPTRISSKDPAPRTLHGRDGARSQAFASDEVKRDAR